MKKKTNNSFLTFILNNEFFALGVEKVLEIIETSDENTLTNLPKAPESVEGVANFRGNVIPIVNTRLKFDMPAYASNERFVIMVLQLNIGGVQQIIGTMADKVVDVIEIQEKDIQAVPEVGQGVNSDYIQGVVHRQDKFIMLLDLESAIQSDEIIRLEDTVETKEGPEDAIIEETIEA